MAAGVAHDALGLAGRAGGVDDVERVGRRHRHAFDLRGRAPRRQARHSRDRGPAISSHVELLALQDQAVLRRVFRQRDRLVEQRLVGDDAAGLEAAGRRDHQLRPGVVDAGGEFLRGEAAEDDRMHRADARAGEHGDRRFRHHRHIDDDAVALLDAVVLQHRGERHHLVAQLAIGEALHLALDGAVVDQRDLVGAAALDMAVEAVEGHVGDRAGEPAAIDAGLGVEHLVPAAEPVDLFGRLPPRRLPGRASSSS